MFFNWRRRQAGFVNSLATSENVRIEVEPNCVFMSIEVELNCVFVSSRSD